MFDLAAKIKSYLEGLEEYEEQPWECVEYDQILVFPIATVFLMSQGSNNIYRQRYPESVETDEQISIE